MFTHRNTTIDSSVYNVTMPPRSQNDTPRMIVESVNGEMFDYAYEDIASFYQLKKAELDDTICKLIEETYPDILKCYDEAKTLAIKPISQEKISELCSQIREPILLAMQQAKKENKPLVILLGDIHGLPESALATLILLRLFKDLNGNGICLEADLELLKKLEKDNYQFNSSFANIFAPILARAYDLSVIPIEKTDTREQYKERKKKEAGIKNLLNLRDKEMADMITSQAKKDWASAKKPTLAICGSIHLEGLYSQLKQNCHILAFNPHIYHRTYIPTPPKELEEAYQFLLSEDSPIRKIPMQDCIVKYDHLISLYDSVLSGLNYKASPDNTAFVLTLLKQKKLTKIEGTEDALNHLKQEVTLIAKTKYSTITKNFLILNVLSKTEELFVDADSSDKADKAIKDLIYTIKKQIYKNEIVTLTEEKPSFWKKITAKETPPITDKSKKKSTGNLPL